MIHNVDYYKTRKKCQRENSTICNETINKTIGRWKATQKSFFNLQYLMLNDNDFTVEYLVQKVYCLCFCWSSSLATDVINHFVFSNVDKCKKKKRIKRSERKIATICNETINKNKNNVRFGIGSSANIVLPPAIPNIYQMMMMNLH